MSKGRKLPKYLTPTQKESVLQVIKDPRDKAIFSLGLNAGLRASEMANLTIDDIDFQDRKIHIKQGKGKKEGFIEINEALYNDLLDLFK